MNPNVYLREWKGVYVRMHPASQPSIPMTNHQKTLDLSRDLDCRTSARISAWFCDRDIHVNIATSEDIEDNNPTGNKVDQRHGPCLQESLKQFNQSNAVGEEFDLPWQPLRFIECPAPSYLGGGFCLLSPAAKISGRKRTNIGDLPSKSPHVQVDMPCPSESDQQKIELEDENGLDGGSSTSGSDSDETLDSALDESLPEDSSVQGRCSPDAPRELQVMRQDLLRFVRQRFITWTASVRYGASSDDEVPPRKRARTVGEQRSQRSEENQVGGEFIIISDLDGHFKLACPFYVSAPRKYRRCFLKTNLQSIKDVICHLRGHHMKPPYCPVCGQAFGRAVDRDEHVRARRCSLRNNLEDIDGISRLQISKLMERDRPRLSEVTRWLKLWATLFPNAEPGRSPYLDKGEERVMSMLRDYWAKYGMDSIREYLASHELLPERLRDDETSLSTLHKLALAHLLRKMFGLEQDLGREHDADC